MFIKLFNSVKITAGAKNAIIFDTDNGFVSAIPKDFFILLSNEKQNYTILRQELEADDLETLNEYIDFIISNRLGFIVNTQKELQQFKNKFTFNENPTNLEYFILDIKDERDIDGITISQIQNLGIRYLQIRVLEQVNAYDIINILLRIFLLNNCDLQEISIVAKYDDSLLKFIKESKNLSSKFLDITLHSGDEKKLFDFGYIRLNVITNKISIPSGCGCISKKNFILSGNFYLESKVHNSCLYKKISIDSDGNIRNCPSMPQSFGNIKDTTLEDALHHKDFKKYWNITKDSIEICKDCEFRYICTDCRAYTEIGGNNIDLDVSKPLKCGYNPYSGIWEDWSINPLKKRLLIIIP